MILQSGFSSFSKLRHDRILHSTRLFSFMSDTPFTGTESTLPDAPEAEISTTDVPSANPEPVADLEVTSAPDNELGISFSHGEAVLEETQEPEPPAFPVVDPKIDEEIASEVDAET